jgi:hypothetical protein
LVPLPKPTDEELIIAVQAGIVVQSCLPRVSWATHWGFQGLKKHPVMAFWTQDTHNGQSAGQFRTYDILNCVAESSTRASS